MKEKALIVTAIFLTLGLLTLAALFMYKPGQMPGRMEPPLPMYWEAPKFSLTDTKGQTFDSAKLDGKIWVADFFFSSCPGPCPDMAKSMAKVDEMFKDNEDVRLVNFSVDPDRDDQATLDKYAKKIGADGEKWSLLRGTAEEIGKLVDQQGFRLGSGDSIMNHSTKFVLVDRKGVIRGFYEGQDLEMMDMLGNHINRVLAERP